MKTTERGFKWTKRSESQEWNAMSIHTYPTCPAWRSDGHRSSSQGYNQKPVCKCGTASSAHSGTLGTQPGRHGTGSKKRQTPPLCLLQWGWHPNTQHWKLKANFKLLPWPIFKASRKGQPSWPRMHEVSMGSPSSHTGNFKPMFGFQDCCKLLQRTKAKILHP